MLLLVKFVFFLVTVLLSTAFFTFLEHKILGCSQLRKGPSKVGFFGVLQPFSDALKLLSSEVMEFKKQSRAVFFLAPVISLTVSMLVWLSIPFTSSMLILNLSLLFVLSCVGFSIYPIFVAGWASNSKYSMVGSLRAVAQMLSYELILTVLIFSYCLVLGSFSLQEQVESSCFSTKVIFFFSMPFWFTVLLAETNRTPFDFSEGESELVSGFNTEYSSGGFVLFFLSEYMSILFMSSFFSLVFLGIPSTLVYIFSSVVLASVFIWVRSTFPRFRYDGLMSFSWKHMLPSSLLCMSIFFSVKFLLT